MGFVSLQSLNFQDRFIRHQNFLGELSPIQSDLDRHDATFQIRDFAGIGDLVTLRSLNFPLHVLRHQDFHVKLHEFNPPLTPPPGLGSRPETPEERLLREDASFFMVHGLADPAGVSFRSLNFPDRFLRHRDFHLFVEPVGDDLGNKDATFFFRSEPFALPEPIVIH
jgi:Alpha-L-arabinofuranosidase B (ABFB) domain